MRTDVNGIEIEYETMGDPADPALLLVMGLGAQMIAWDDEFCLGLVDRGFFVIRFDNRDVGLSTKVVVDPEIDVMTAITEAMGGRHARTRPTCWPTWPPTPSGVLDALGIDQAHVCGASMGGMIAQSIAIARARAGAHADLDHVDHRRPRRGPAPPRGARRAHGPTGHRSRRLVAQSVAGSRAIGSPEHFDEARAAEMAGRAYDRCYYPAGVAHQLVAIVSSPSRSEALSQLRPAHAGHPRLRRPAGRPRRAARARPRSSPAPSCMMLEGMGHDLPVHYWPTVIEAITGLAARSAAAA